MRYRGTEYALFCNEFADGTLAPKGYMHIESFHLDGGLPVWRYAVADALIEKRIAMQPGRNTTLVNLKVLRASDRLTFTMTPLCTYRDYHGHSRGGWDLAMSEIPQGVEIKAFPDAKPYRIGCERAEFVSDPVWYWNFKHRAETARGLDDNEDLFRPGYFCLTLSEDEQATVTLSAEPQTADNFTQALQQNRNRQQALLKTLPGDAPGWIRQLALAAGQFIVERYQDGQAAGKPSSQATPGLPTGAGTR